jgi:hypothetical protein
MAVGGNEGRRMPDFTWLSANQGPDQGRTVLADPEGNEFCVLTPYPQTGSASASPSARTATTCSPPSGLGAVLGGA